MKTRNIIVEVVCFLYVVLFLYAALAKLTEYDRFVVQLEQSPLLNPFAIFISWLVPAIEIALAFMLMFSRFRYFALLASFTLMVMFTLYIGSILLFADRIPCSCGGILEKMGWVDHVYFNVGFVFLAMLGIYFLRKNDDGENAVAIN